MRKEIKNKARRQNCCPVPKQNPPKLDEAISNSIWTKHIEKLKNISSGSELSDGQMPPELKLYFNSAVLPLSEDPIKYW